MVLLVPKTSLNGKGMVNVSYCWHLVRVDGEI